MVNDHTTNVAKATEPAYASAPTQLHPFTESVEYLTTSLVTEQKEKEKRQLNVIIYKLDAQAQLGVGMVGYLPYRYLTLLYNQNLPSI